MTAPRSLRTLLAAGAAATLTVAGLVAGTAPVSAAPVSSVACERALAALQSEFGDLDVDALEDLDKGELDALVEQHDAATEAHVAALERRDALQASYAALGIEGRELRAVVLETRAERDAADVVLAEARVALDAALDGGDDEEVAAAQQVFDDALAAATVARQTAEDAYATWGSNVDVAFNVYEQLEYLALDIVELEAELDGLGDLFADLDVDRLLELLEPVAAECAEAGERPAGTDVDTQDRAPHDARDRAGTATVATPVVARASFTG